MTVYISKTEKGNQVSFNAYKDVWELQDNGHSELVIKFHNHECVRINEDEIIDIEVELWTNGNSKYLTY